MIWLLLYFCLFSVKLPLLGGTLAGPALRIDDLLIALATPALVWRAARLHFFRNTVALTMALVLFTLEGLFSAAFAVAARDTDAVTALTYAVRPLEYAVFVLVGYIIATTGRERLLHRCLAIYTVYFTVLSVLQVAGLHIGASQFAYSRAAGNTSGPYEAAVVAGFLFFYFLAKRNWPLASLALLSALLTDSRVTTLSILAVSLLMASRQLHLRRVVLRFLLGGAAAAALVSILLLLFAGSDSTPSIIARLEQTQIGSSWAVATTIRDGTPPVATPAEYAYYAYPQLTDLFKQPDASTLIRFARWQIGLKAWANDGGAIVFGLGPSFAGAATDGYYVRVLVGQGVLGVALFLWLLRRIWLTRHSFPGAARYIVTLVFTGCFIDIFVSYRPMMLMWIAVGAAIGSQHRSEDSKSERLANAATVRLTSVRAVTA
jgi:hypothetical protein